MMLRVFGLWLLGLVIIVPYAVYRLLFDAGVDEYAFLIVVPLFWIFGFWGVVGPLIGAYKVHKLMKALETCRTNHELMEAYQKNEGKDVIVDFIARENGLPRFLVRRIYHRIEQKLREKPESPTGASR